MRVSISVASLVVCVSALGKLEPPDGRVIVGFWFDGNPGNTNTSLSGGDSSSAVNKRIGLNAGAFQLVQALPLKVPDSPTPLKNADGSANVDVLDDGTNAALFLTVYPQNNDVADADIVALATQCQNITTRTGRDIFIRFGPEMNGDWFPYGNQPTQFISLWQRVHTTLNQIVPNVAMVWSPSYNYNSYSAFWPGAEYVDWVGLSVYWKGTSADATDNQLCPDTYAAQIINSDPGAFSEPTYGHFYNDYAVKYNKPFVVPETGAAFQIKSIFNGVSSVADIGPGQAALQMSHWNSLLFNPALRTQYPLFKMAISFEIYKIETDGTYNGNNKSEWRDYRSTVEPQTLAQFSAGLRSLGDAAIWASPSGNGGLLGTANVNTSAVSVPSSTVSAVASSMSTAVKAADNGVTPTGAFSSAKSDVGRIHWEWGLVVVTLALTFGI
ncbi:glycoside hydrolase superfamily [Chytriomyces sp. MP71]|nr:glycoside hydrolase superfamily [Chytriomyces sp. MP71]